MADRSGTASRPCSSKKISRSRRESRTCRPTDAGGANWTHAGAWAEAGATGNARHHAIAATTIGASEDLRETGIERTRIPQRFYAFFPARRRGTLIESFLMTGASAPGKAPLRTSTPSPLRLILSALSLVLFALPALAAVPFPMAGGNYAEDFADISNWTNNFG